MAAKPKNKLWSGLGAAFALSAIYFNHPGKQWLIVLCVALSVSLVYGFSDWPRRTGFTVAEKMGRWVALVLICSLLALCWGSLWWPRWSLSSSQRTRLAALAKEIPKNVAFVVEVPPTDELGKQFGHELMSVFADNGASVNKITVVRGLGEDPVGIIILVPQQEECPAYRYGSGVSSVMSQIGIPAHLSYQQGLGMADCNGFVVLVGTKPRDD